MKVVEALNAAAAALHLLQAIAVAVITAAVIEPRTSPALFARGRFDVSRGARVLVRKTEETYAAPGLSATARFEQGFRTQPVPSGFVHVPAIIAVFFFLSAAFQGAASVLNRGRSGVYRFVEYSLTASMMVLAIAVEAGISDVYTLECMFVLTWVTQLIGIVAERAQALGEPWFWIHVTAWVTCIAAYAPILDCYLLSVNRSEVRPPDFVSAIVFLEFVLFVCFGFVQTYVLFAKASATEARESAQSEEMAAFFASDNRFDALSATVSRRGMPSHRKTAAHDAIDDAAECAYIVLSLVAKTLLGWIIMGPVMGGNV